MVGKSASGGRLARSGWADGAELGHRAVRRFWGNVARLAAVWGNGRAVGSGNHGGNVTPVSVGCQAAKVGRTVAHSLCTKREPDTAIADHTGFSCRTTVWSSGYRLSAYSAPYGLRLPAFASAHASMIASEIF